jgi:putative ABC transport system permease protein
MRDLRYAARVLWHSPGFAAASVLVLALGIGATSAIFSVVDAAVLRPLPFHRPGELVVLWERAPGNPVKRTWRATPLNFLDWHDQNTVFSGLAAVSGGNKTLAGRDGAEQIAGQSVSREFFSVLGVPPIAGRAFQEEDERTKANVVMLSERIWRTRFGGDPKLVGRTIPLDGEAYTVIGIVPAHAQVFYEADLWTLYVVKRSPEQRRMHYLQVIGRLKPGVTIEQARAGMAAVADSIARLFPGTNKDWGITIETLHESVVGKELRSTTLVLGGVVAFVLLMACANVANLMLARGASRAREMAVRVALGAGRWTLARQLLSESLVLAAMGGAAGLSLAWALIRAAERVVPAGTMPAGVAISLDARVAAFTALITLATGILFGLAPVWQVSRSGVAEGLRAGGRGASGGNARLLGGLAMVEIAMAVLVVTGAGLFLRTLYRLTEVDPGYRAEQVLTAHVTLPLSVYKTPERALEFYEAAQREMESLRGVRSASFGGALPLTGFDIGQGFNVVGAPPVPRDRLEAVHYQIVGARYFETLGIPLQAGRTFDSRDRKGGQDVAIVNQEFARRYLQGRRPVGTHIEVHAMDPGGPKLVDREIVGVVGQVRVDSLGESVNAIEVYVPISQNPWFSASIAIRGTGGAEAMAPSLRAAIARADRGLAVTQVRTMDEIVSENVAGPRFRARLLGGFAAVALLLAAVGIFGVLAFSVSQRRREFGIRMAVGAQSSDVLGMVLGRGLKIAAGGIAAGLAGAALLARAASTLLFRVQALDGESYGFAAVLLAAVALAAGVVPAMRAAQVDPAVTLREE